MHKPELVQLKDPKAKNTRVHSQIKLLQGPEASFSIAGYHRTSPSRQSCKTTTMQNRYSEITNGLQRVQISQKAGRAINYESSPCLQL